MFFKVTVERSQPFCTAPIYEVYPILEEYKDFYNNDDDEIEMSMEEKDMWKLIKKLVNEKEIIISRNNENWFTIEIYDFWRE